MPANDDVVGNMHQVVYLGTFADDNQRRGTAGEGPSKLGSHEGVSEGVSPVNLQSFFLTPARGLQIVGTPL